MSLRLQQLFLILLLLGSLVSFGACSQGPGPTASSAPSSNAKVHSAQRAVRGADTISTIQAKPEWFTCKTDDNCMAIGYVILKTRLIVCFAARLWNTAML